MKPNLTPRAWTALTVSAGSLFLLLCFAGYGAGDASSVRPLGLSDRIASWFVEPLGVGAHLIAVLGAVWGAIVFFQERTPDLVLRGVGTLTLAASSAMLAGLVHGGVRTTWSGTVGTAGAKTMLSLGAFGTVLGWLVALGLFGVSLVFATDWLFHTLRRGARPAFDPRAIPTEPPRAEFRDDAGPAEAREFVRAESHAATVAQAIPAAPPKPLEVAPETLPAGFSAVATEERTVVRGPSGYRGVEFLPPSDDLAVPDAPHAGGGRTFVGAVDDEPGHEIAFEPAADLATPESEFARGAASAPVPASGISLADASLLDDEVFSVPSFSDADVPHDGASAADEIAASFAAPDAPPAPDVPAPVAARTETPAVPAPEASDESGEVAAPAFLDDLLVGGTSFLDDEVFVVPGTPGGATSFEAAPSASAVAVAEEPVRTAVAAPAAPVAAVDAAVVADESGIVEEEFAVAGFAVVDLDEVLVPAVAEDVAPAEDAPVAVAEAPEVPAPAPVAESAPDVAAPAPEVSAPALFSAAALAETPVIEPPPAVAAHALPSVSAPEPEAPVAPAPAAGPAAADDDLPLLDEVADESPAAGTTPAPDAAPEPVASVPAAEPSSPPDLGPPADAPAPAAAAAPGAAAEVAAPASEESAKPSQLALFAAPACDMSRLHSMELDPLFHDAAAAIVARGRASAVVLQRALGIGYARGLRILDQMTEAGMLGPDAPGGAREICFTKEQWEAFARSI